MILFIFIITAFNLNLCMNEARSKRTPGPILRQLMEANKTNFVQLQPPIQQNQSSSTAHIDNPYFALGQRAYSAAQRPPFAKK